MNTQQLLHIIECDSYMKNIVSGVYPADQLPFPPFRQPVGLVANCDPMNAPGSHWVAFFIENNILECFDSYGKQPDKLSHFFKLFVSRFSNIRVNNKRLQSSESIVCGQ